MHYKWLILLLTYILAQQAFANAVQKTDRDAEIIKSCLGSHVKNVEVVTNYTNWSVEEMPCFTRCISEAKGWFDVQTNRWNRRKIVEELGACMYNYCRFVLNRPIENACEFAHQGLRCLKQAEHNIPLIDAALIGCSLELNISLNQLAKYIPLQSTEQIPCYFECFARKMDLYDSNFEWNVDNWIKAFGSPYSDISLHRNNCKATDSRIRPQASNCSWMYAEYLCVDHLSYHSIHKE